MKKQSLLFFFAISLFFVGCSIEKRHYNSGYHVEWYSQRGKIKKAEPVAQPEKENKQSLAVQQEVTNESDAHVPVSNEEITKPTVSNESATIAPVKSESKKNVAAKTEKKTSKSTEAKVEGVKPSSIEKGFSAKSSMADLDSPKSPLSVDEILLIILCFLLPPLAVYLDQGSVNRKFWISVILTLLIWVPGIVYAILVVTDNI